MLTVVDALLFVSLGLLGVRAFWKDDRSHLVGLTGWILFGIFWWFQLPGYIAHSDYFNSLAAFLALPAFAFLGYHEYLSYKWKEEYQPLKFLAIATFFAATIYFVVEKTPQISGPLTKVVADHSVALLNAFGHNYGTGPVEYISGELSVPIYNSTVRIILACTALQAMTVSGGFILSSSESWKRKGAVLALVLVPIYLVNLARNAVVIYLCDVQGMSFEIAHGVVGKSISLITLVILVVVAFILLPSLYDNIVGVLDLPWRKGPNHEYKNRLFGRTITKGEEAIDDSTEETERS